MAEESHSFIDALVGERIGGRYVVERVLRAGGMGVVAAGRYPELDQEVAIKFMRPEYASSSILSARFLREARVAARVKSPHFVRIFDFGKLDTGVPYLVMEMLRGRDLRDELDVQGPLSVEDAVDYVLQAALGIAELHALGIVHRDLKPSNLFLSEAAGSKTIKVLDFGVSKESSGGKGELTSTGNVIGTPQYMSPEQIRESRTADVRSDVWSLGVILFELLTTTVPFGEGTEAIGEVYGLVLHTDPVKARARRADLPEALEVVILKCLARDLADRYANVADLAEALRPFASPAAGARIGAVREALVVRSVPVGPDDSGSGRALAVARPMAATAESSPQGKRKVTPPSQAETTDSKPVAAAASGAISGRPVGETGMTASRKSTPAPAGSPDRTRRVAVVFALALLVIAGTAAVMSRGTGPRTDATSAPSVAPVAPDPIPAPVTSTAVTTSLQAPVASAAPLASAPAPTAPAAPASTAQGPTANAAPEPLVPHVRPPVHRIPPRPAPTASAPADLLLDRK